MSQKTYTLIMGQLYGYIRTSRRQIEGQAGRDPESHALQLRGAGVASDRVYHDVGVSASGP